jgi:biotin carboxyl carrier protein
MSERETPVAQDGILTDPDAIRQIGAWLAEARLEEIEISSDTGARLRISVAPSARGMTSAPDDHRPAKGPGERDTSVVSAPYFGRLRLGPAPDHAAFAPVGAFVRSGEAVALLELEMLSVPVLAPCDGKVVEILAPAGSLVGYNDPIMMLNHEPRPT